MKKGPFVLEASPHAAVAALVFITLLVPAVTTSAGTPASFGRIAAPEHAAAPTPPVEHTVKLPLLLDSQGGRMYGLVASSWWRAARAAKVSSAWPGDGSIARATEARPGPR